MEARQHRRPYTGQTPPLTNSSPARRSCGGGGPERRRTAGERARRICNVSDQTPNDQPYPPGAKPQGDETKEMLPLTWRSSLPKSAISGASPYCRKQMCLASSMASWTMLYGDITVSMSPGVTRPTRTRKRNECQHEKEAIGVKVLERWEGRLPRTTHRSSLALAGRGATGAGR